MRATACALAALLVSVPAWSQRREPVWPIANGTHDVLHNFQNPFWFIRYFHEGVDLRRSGNVVAMRGGIVRYVNQGDAGGTLRIEVQTPSGIESDSYVHLRLEPWLVGDVIRAGERVGRTSRSYFPFEREDHVHLNRFRGQVSGNGYVVGRTNMLNPLALFRSTPERDPQLQPPLPADADLDGRVFWIAPPGSPNTHLDFASGAVELFAEAVDRMSDSLHYGQGVHGIGYWIESLAGGEDVASAEKPYRLLRFDDSWRASHPNCDELVGLALLAEPAHAVDDGPDDIRWTTLGTYRLTRAAGFHGRPGDISAAQAWHTEARRGTGAPNGTGCLPARSPEEARFPDGTYRVHVVTEDLVHAIDTTFDVMVDNFQPAVASLRVVDVSGEHELGRSTWELDVETGERGTTSTPGPPLRAGDRVRLELELSEPMAVLDTVALEPALGALTSWASIQEPRARTRFQAELDVSATPLGPVRLRLAGRDHAGRALVASTTGRTAGAAASASADCVVPVPVALALDSGRDAPR